MEKETKTIIKRKEFTIQAGEMIIENNKVKPNPDKGELKFYFNPDGLLCLEWKNLTKNITSDYIAILPNDWTWKKIGSQKGRIFLLENILFPEIKHFYWMQYNKEMDESISTIISNILSTGTLEINECKQQQSQGMSMDDVIMEEEKKNQTSSIVSNINQPLNNNNQQQQQSMFPNQQSTDDFIKQFTETMKKIQKNYPELGKVLTSKNVKALINNLDKETLEVLFVLLPEKQQNMQGLIENITSPQFQQGLEQMTTALNSENLSAIIQSFQLNIEIAQKYPNGVEAFIRCIIDKFKNK